MPPIIFLLIFTLIKQAFKLEPIFYLFSSSWSRPLHSWNCSHWCESQERKSVNGSGRTPTPSDHTGTDGQTAYCLQKGRNCHCCQCLGELTLAVSICFPQNKTLRTRGKEDICSICRKYSFWIIREWALLSLPTKSVFDPQGVSDGAAAVIVASEDAVKEHKFTPLARIVAYHVSGCDPSIMGIGEWLWKIKLNQCSVLINDLLVLISLISLNAARSCSCSYRSTQESWSDHKGHGSCRGL